LPSQSATTPRVRSLLLHEGEFGWIGHLREEPSGILPTACARHSRRRLHLPVGHGAARSAHRRAQPRPDAEQVRTTLSNMRHMVESAGSSLERVVRVQAVLADISHRRNGSRAPRILSSRTAGAHRLVHAAALRQGSSAWRGIRLCSVPISIAVRPIA
jgi:hypothetical protein